jgi:hypothetical protein
LLREKGEEMNTQTETKMKVNANDVSTKTENPMQERHIGKVAESVEATAKDVLMSRRLEVRDDTGPIFVP